jgi:hypothetical protein
MAGSRRATIALAVSGAALFASLSGYAGATITSSKSDTPKVKHENTTITVKGAQGPRGPKGAKGNTGAKGATGATGAQGIQGLQGYQGVPGPGGPVGPAGPPGANGINGTPGGPQGPAGAAGADGAPGTPGATGPPGAPGGFNPNLVTARNSNPSTVQAGQTATLTETCNAGEIAIAGGFQSTDRVELIQSARAQPPTWQVVLYNPNATSVLVTVQAICAAS